MADHERVSRMTTSLVELFPGEKNKIEKEKWYYDHGYTTFTEWQTAIDDIIDSITAA